MSPRYLLLLLPCLLASGPGPSAFERKFVLNGTFEQQFPLKQGETAEISAGLSAPSQLPPNARIAVEWGGYRKVLHALDPDIYFVFRAPQAGAYTLKMSAVTDEEPVFNNPRWREQGTINALTQYPKKTPDPGAVNVWASIKPLNPGVSKRGMQLEAEPNDSIADAQPVTLAAGDQDQTLHVLGGSDEIEYFDNGKFGQSGDDYFRFEFKGAKPKLFTANVIVTDPLVNARLRFYTPDGKEYTEGANPNERVHQQLEEHRTEISRTLKPGGVYLLRVEANSPGYDLELRLRQLGPFTDPRQAVRQAMYDHMAQVNAWLLNRPRGAAVDRRIRDTGSLLGTHCMSCHTQSGVWGPTVPMLKGYRAENVFNYRHLVNLMYESLRPTNELKEAANNTSLPPLDLGDGPAGTRVAGYNVATHERLVKPRKLHSMQQIRTANFVLQSADPSGVNAAGPGSNIGQAVVWRYAGEVLRTAWDKTRDPKYRAGLEDKAKKMIGLTKLKYTDDYAHRLEFFERLYPKQWHTAEIKALLDADEKVIRQRQRADGSWGFDTGEATFQAPFNNGTRDGRAPDPAPISVCLSALESRGYGVKDPAVARGVKALLKMQDPYGRWNQAAITGFVTTSYAMHALSLLYPEKPAPRLRSDYAPKSGESLADTVARFRALAHLGLEKDDRKFLDLARAGVKHASPHVRYWALRALGAMPDAANVDALLDGLGDPVKMVRESARWSLRQNLLDDHGWAQIFPFYQKASDAARQELAAALIMRADTVMPKSAVDPARLAEMFDQMMVDDPHPGVRAWAPRAAWNWWVWNPPVREGVNAAWVRMLETPETSSLAENAKRYQSQALFIANGQRANGSKEHQYPELKKLFATISAKLEQPQEPMLTRVVNIAGTYYNQAGGDGGPGQMGYVTEGSAEMVGKAVLHYLARAEKMDRAEAIKLSLESAANATYSPLQKRLLDYATSGPEHLRTIAATSVSDPRVISLPGTQEFLEPLIEQLNRGAVDKDRRKELAAPIFRLFSRARWNIPATEEQQRTFYGLLMPKFEDPKNEAQFYLAEQFGRVLGSNPDLRNDLLVKNVPRTFRNELEEAFWLPSVPWMLTEGTPVPEVGQGYSEGPLAPIAEKLYLKQLEPGADDRLAKMALAMASEEAILKNETIAKVLRTKKKDFFEKDVEEVATLSPEWKRNFEYFRNHVVPELKRPNREDEQACMSCHGVAGRVPSLELTPPNREGYLNSKGAYQNFRLLLERVNEQDVEASKLLRKPLNIQTGQEDGHQGGRRYNPMDRGYEVLKRWVMDAAALKKKGVALQASR